MTNAMIARLKVVLDDVEPAVIRRLDVPLALRLDRLHRVLQTALGWTDSHLYEFRFRDVGFGIPDPDWSLGDGPLDARKATLRAAIEDSGAKSFKYLYDFGDGWEHSIKIEKIAAATPGMTYPFLLQATGRCPPEDIGGPPGYEEFLQACADPDHEGHDDALAWAGGTFDPETVDTAAVDAALNVLARKWTRTPRLKP